MLVAASADIVITAPRTFRNLAEIENPAENLVGVASAGSEGAITAAQLAVRPGQPRDRGPRDRARHDHQPAQRRGQGQPVLPARLQPRSRLRLRADDRRHSGQHADARARAGLRRLELPDPRAGERRAVPQGSLLRGERRLLVRRLGQHQLLQRRSTGRSSASPAARSATAASSAPSRRASAPATCSTAFEWERDNGPWVSPNNKDKFNGVVRYSQGNARNGLSLTFLGFRTTGTRPTRFRSAPSTRADQPLRVHRGNRRRRDVPLQRRRSTGSGPAPTTRRASPAYVQRYGVQLFHNFTYFLERPGQRRPVRAVREPLDERRQADAPAAAAHRRQVHRERVRRRRAQRFGRRAARPVPHARNRAAATRCAPTTPIRVGRHVRRRRRSNGAARCGRRSACAATSTTGTSSPTTRSTPATRPPAIVSPKVSAAFGPWGGTEFYANWGLGLPLQLRPGHRAAGRSVHRRAGRRRRRRSRAPTAAEFGVRTRGAARAADDGDGLVSRLRLRADLRRRFRQHRGRAGQPPHGRRDHQLHLSEPLDDASTSTSRSRARASSTFRRARTSCRARSTASLRQASSVNPPAGVATRAVRQRPASPFRAARRCSRTTA